MCALLQYLVNRLMAKVPNPLAKYILSLGDIRDYRAGTLDSNLQKSIDMLSEWRKETTVGQKSSLSAEKQQEKDLRETEAQRIAEVILSQRVPMARHHSR
jgi:hypothetical protein